MLAEMAIEIDGARLLAWEAAWTLDQGGSALRESTLAIVRRASRTLGLLQHALDEIAGASPYMRSGGVRAAR